MKNPIWSFILLLIITFSVITFYSFTSYQITIGEYDIEKTKIKEFIENSSKKPIGKNFAFRDTVRVIEKAPVMDTSSQRILLIGDSML